MPSQANADFEKVLSCRSEGEVLSIGVNFFRHDCHPSFKSYPWDAVPLIPDSFQLTSWLRPFRPTKIRGNLCEAQLTRSNHDKPESCSKEAAGETCMFLPRQPALECLS